MSRTSCEFFFPEVFSGENRSTRRFVIARKAGLSEINQPSPFRLPGLLGVVTPDADNGSCQHPASRRDLAYL